MVLGWVKQVICLTWKLVLMDIGILYFNPSQDLGFFFFFGMGCGVLYFNPSQI